MSEVQDGEVYLSWLEAIAGRTPGKGDEHGFVFVGFDEDRSLMVEHRGGRWPYEYYLDGFGPSGTVGRKEAIRILDRELTTLEASP